MSSKSVTGWSLDRRQFLATAATGSAVFATGLIGGPAILRAQGQTVKVGVLHPVTGALAFSGQQGRLGAQIAIDEINEAGGIKSLGGAKIEPILGDAQSKPDTGSAEVEKMNSAGALAVVGGYSSSICLAASQTAARYGLPYIVDVGVSDEIMSRGLENTFRFSPGFGTITQTAIDNLVKINEAAGKPARTVMIIHEDSLFGSGLANLLNQELPNHGFEVVETIGHATPARDFNNVVLRMRAAKPDIVIPANYYNEYVLLARTMRQQRIKPKAVYSVLGGAASNFRFVEEFPDAAQYIMDCNHWYDPKDEKAQTLRTKVESMDQFFTYELFLNYTAIGYLADALGRAGNAERSAVIQALASSTWDGHIMPYGPTEIVKGQNQGARPVNTQVLGDDIEVIFPEEFASAKPVFPMPEAS